MDDEINPSILEEIQKHGSKKNFNAEETLIFQGDQSQTIGYIIEGRAKAVAYSEHGDETWLCFFTEGDFFGHTSFLTNAPINFEITAVTDMETYSIPVGRLPELLSDKPVLGQFLAADLARRLDTMATRLIEAINLSAPGRICSELMRLSRPVGVDPMARIIRPNPVFVDVALRVGSTRETVSRTVNKLIKDGVASREPGAILIAHPETLQGQIK